MRPHVLANRRLRRILLFGIVELSLFFAVQRPTLAQDDEARSGLIAELSDGQSTVTRVDTRLVVDSSRQPVDVRLSEVREIRWSGTLLARVAGVHTFHAQLNGSCSIRIDNQVVFDTNAEDAFVSGTPIDLTGGDHEIEIRFRSPADGAKSRPRFAVFWSSPSFTLEPIPSDALSHIPGGEPDTSSDGSKNEHAVKTSDAHQLEFGRSIVDSLRCGACHTGLAEAPTLAAPDLTLALRFTDDQHLARWLLDPDRQSGMPHFPLTADQAADVIAFLRTEVKVDAKPDTLTKAASEKKLKEGDLDGGSKLLSTMGCAACHRLPGPELQLSAETEFQLKQTPDLRTVGERRSSDWITTWLTRPEVLNPAHRMPRFELSDDEVRQLVVALSKAKSNEPDESATPATEVPKAILARGDADRGRKWIQEARCSSCHMIPGISPENTDSQRVARPVNKDSLLSSASCLQSIVDAEEGSAGPNDGFNERQASGKLQPLFRVTPHDRDAAVAWVASLPNDLTKGTGISPELLMSRSGCLQCHDRDVSRGVSVIASQIESTRDDLRGQSQALIPPSLTAVGDRLKDEVLLEAVTGATKTRRLPWLHVRMPRFRFTPEEAESLTQHLIQMDRIPDSADAVRSELFRHFDPKTPSPSSPEELLSGNQLAGAAGFNCLACHKAGAFEPRNVAMGTRGSDIMQMGQRLRSRYFLRWMQNPIRVLPGVEMPAIRRAVPGIAGESLPAQIAVLWKALSDKRFTPPTVASRYEQIVTVAPTDRPRVIRDVFTLSNDRAAGSIPRAFAVGFPNGHSLLLDLDTMSIQQWTFGEFARQRTEGKSWFWDMAGVQLMDPAKETAWCQLHVDGQPDGVLNPLKDQRRSAELLDWKVESTSVLLRVRFHFGPESKRVSEGPHDVVTEWNDPDVKRFAATVMLKISPAEAPGQSGLQLNASVQELSEGCRLAIPGWTSAEFHREIPARAVLEPAAKLLARGDSVSLTLTTSQLSHAVPVDLTPTLLSSAETLSVLPGFAATRQPLPASIMPTAIAVRKDGSVAFTSLRGHVWIATDSNNDGLLDHATRFAEGLAAPYGIVADEDSVIVSHKPEVVRLRDTDSDGKADAFHVIASGWGYSDDYHDWTSGLVKSRSGSLYAGLGSDYSQNQRPKDNDRWRGTVLKIDGDGSIQPVAYSLRFPMGLAFDRDEHLFVTDNQGVQNTFNEINMVIPGKHYGVPSRHERSISAEPETPALMVPHPWTRSVNAIAFFPNDYPVPQFRGHGVGCEYDTRCLIRFTTQDVDGVIQGACYRLSRVSEKGGGENFVGPIACTFGNDGSLWVGSIWDSGWQGGSNTGCLERIRPADDMLNGIREVKATSDGFEVSFFKPVQMTESTKPENWSLQGYTRAWQGSYATPDSDRHALKISSIQQKAPETLVLQTSELKAGYVYEISVSETVDANRTMWPAEAHYTMKTVPK
ncbi:MAG: c-type cytochrome [Planctomycetaceae bacterium]|nr:c-type cytochrome [Planctomycetaceae bacterium]